MSLYLMFSSALGLRRTVVDLLLGRFVKYSHMTVYVRIPSVRPSDLVLSHSSQIPCNVCLVLPGCDRPFGRV